MKNTKPLKQRIEKVENRLDILEYWMQQVIKALKGLDIRTKGMCNGMSAFSKVMSEHIQDVIESKKESNDILDRLMEGTEKMKVHCKHCNNEE